jgi:hypothetical protein
LRYIDAIGNPINYDVEESVIEEKTSKVPLAKIIKSDYTREIPIQVTFDQLIRYHDRTPQLQVAVSTYAELITGTEMNVECKSDEATKLLDDWIRNCNFYDKFESMVRTVLMTGNAILEKLDEHDTQDVSEVDMATIIAKKRDEYGELQYYEQRTQNGQTDQLGLNRLGKFVEFNLTNYSRQAWGKSLFYGLAVPRATGNRTTAPLIEVMWGIEDAMSAIILNNAYPITTITYPGASDDYLEKEATRWQRYKPGDKRVQKIKPDIEFFETAGNSKYTDYINHIEKVFELGTQFPHDILTGDFTSRASSETTENLVQKKVRGYQRYLANKLKVELFDNVLIQGGFDPEVEECTVQFTSQNVLELEVDQVKDCVVNGIMTKMEGREWLRNNTGMELPDDKEIEDKELAQADMMKQADNIKKEHINKFNLEQIAAVTTKPKKTCKMCKEGQHAFCSKRGCECN